MSFMSRSKCIVSAVCNSQSFLPVMSRVTVISFVSHARTDYAEREREERGERERERDRERQRERERERERENLLRLSFHRYIISLYPPPWW